MAKKASLKSIAKLMRKLDLCMFTTITARGLTASRPMSTNGDVQYNGKSIFFTEGKSHIAKEIAKNKHVGLSFIGIGARKKTFVSVSGNAKLIKDREKMREHWSKEIESWFDNGIDTPGITMIEVDAKHIKYWSGREQGEFAL